jgi:hypothetical protein
MMPQDIRAMQNLSRLVIVNSQLETFDAVDAAQNLQYLYVFALSGGRICL